MFRALIAALGVSARHNYDMNSLAVPRKAKEVGEGGGREGRRRGEWPDGRQGRRRLLHLKKTCLCLSPVM